MKLHDNPPTEMSFVEFSIWANITADETQIEITAGRLRPSCARRCSISFNEALRWRHSLPMSEDATDDLHAYTVAGS
jgi:hypothetical protein